MDTSITRSDIDQVVAAIRSSFPEDFADPESLVVCDFRDDGEGFKIVPHGLDPLVIAAALNDAHPGMPQGTHVEVGWGGMYLYRD